MWKILQEEIVPNSLEIMDYFEYKEINKIKKDIKNILNKKFSRILDFNDSVWEWDNAIILNYPENKNRVIKIPKKWCENNLDLEIKRHNEFFKALEEIKTEFKDSGEFDQYKIPEVYEDWDTWFYEMDKIQWQNYVTKFYLYYYKKELSEYADEYLKGLTDIQVELILQKKWLDLLATTQEEIENLYFWNMNFDLEDSFLEYWNLKLKSIKKLIKILKSKWLNYLDLQPRNFMEDNEWNIYMIDFYT